MRKRVRDADARAGQLEEVERRLAARQHEEKFARQVLAIIGHQATRGARLAAADDIVVNDDRATLDSLRQDVDALHARYLSLAGDTSNATS